MVNVCLLQTSQKLKKKLELADKWSKYKKHSLFTVRLKWYLEKKKEVSWSFSSSTKIPRRDSRAPLSVVTVFLLDWSVFVRNLSPDDRLSYWFRVGSKSKRSFHCDRGPSLRADKLRTGHEKTKVVRLRLTLWNTARPDCTGNVKRLHRLDGKARYQHTRLTKYKGRHYFLGLASPFWSQCRRHVFPVTWVCYLWAERFHCCYYPEACAVTPRGVPSVVKLMQYPSTVRRQLRLSTVVSAQSSVGMETGSNNAVQPLRWKTAIR